MRQACLVQQLGDDFRVLDGSSTHQHRLATLVAFADVGNSRLVLLARRLVHAVELVVALAGPVGRDHHGFQAVDFLELIGLGIGRTGHARELVIEAEVVLEGDGGQRLVLGLDVHAFLGFDGLVQAFAPAAAGHQAARELVHDHDLAVLHDVVLVAVVEMVGAQRRVQVMHQRDVGRIVERRPFRNQPLAGQDALCILVALLRQEHLVRLFVEGEIPRFGHALARTRVGLTLLAHQQGHHLVHGHIQRRVVLCLAADDQGGTRLIDQDGVHLIDDGVVEAALHALARVVHHVVTQVVEPVLVVRSVGDVRLVGSLLFFAGHLRQVDTHREAQEVVQPPHPLRVTARKIVVHCHHVHALAR